MNIIWISQRRLENRAIFCSSGQFIKDSMTDPFKIDSCGSFVIPYSCPDLFHTVHLCTYINYKTTIKEIIDPIDETIYQTEKFEYRRGLDLESVWERNLCLFQQT